MPAGENAEISPLKDSVKVSLSLIKLNNHYKRSSVLGMSQFQYVYDMDMQMYTYKEVVESYCYQFSYAYNSKKAEATIKSVHSNEKSTVEQV